jgi:hypothetical protein
MNEEINSINIPNNRNRNLQRLIRNLKGDIGNQLVCIYSSYMVDPVLWNWVGKKVEHSLSIDCSLNIFIFKLMDGNYYQKKDS